MTDNIDELIQQVSTLPDPHARAVAMELVQSVMELHASALRRVLELAPDVAPRLAADVEVSRVLVLHGLHPDDFETRFARAIAKLGPGIEVLERSPEVVHVRAHRPKAVIEDVLYEAVPEIGELIVESTEQEREPGFVPLSSLLVSL